MSFAVADGVGEAAADSSECLDGTGGTAQHAQERTFRDVRVKTLRLVSVMEDDDRSGKGKIYE